ncbi:hypothetical protein ES703_32259 [subsurface metagenome]
MRTIKFRAWVKPDKCMIEHRETIERAHLQFNDELGGHKDIIMQFTGLKDKNGKEIYEGDILAPMSNDFHPKYEGKWIVDFEGGTFIAKCKDGDNSQWLSYWSYDIYAETEIIGNIYENKDLLKGN